MIEFKSLNSIIKDILETIRNSNVSQSETISTRQIESWIHQYRALLLKRDIDKGKSINPDYIQYINGLELESVDMGLNTSIKTYSNIQKTILPIPKTIDLNFKRGITYVGTMNGVQIDLVPESRIKFSKWKKYSVDMPLAYTKGDYLYVYNGDLIKYIEIRGIFEIPSDLNTYTNITGEPVFTLNSKYPIPEDMLPILKEFIYQKELQIMIQAPTDKSNNSTNDVQ